MVTNVYMRGVLLLLVAHIMPLNAMHFPPDERPPWNASTNPRSIRRVPGLLLKRDVSWYKLLTDLEQDQDPSLYMRTASVAGCQNCQRSYLLRMQRFEQEREQMQLRQMSLEGRRLIFELMQAFATIDEIMNALRNSNEQLHMALHEFGYNMDGAEGVSIEGDSE